MNRIIILLGTFAMAAMEQQTCVPSLYHLCAQRVVKSLETEPQQLLTRDQAHNRTADQLLYAVLDKLPLECSKYFLNFVHLKRHPQLDGLQEIVKNTAVIYKPSEDYLQLINVRETLELAKIASGSRVQISQDGQHIAYKSLHGPLYRCSAPDWSQKNLIRECFKFVFDKDNNLITEYLRRDLISTGPDGSHACIGHSKVSIEGSYFAASHSLLLGGFHASWCAVYDIVLRTEKKKYTFPDLMRVKATASIDKDCELLALNGGKSPLCLTIINIHGAEIVINLHPSSDDDFICASAFDPTGRYIAISTSKSDHKIYLFDIDNSDVLLCT